MAKRVDQNELNFDVEIKELSKTGRKNVIASVENSKKEAEIEALKLRLQGKPAYIQNGLQGKYEVLASERKTETRKLDATFKEVGAGIYRAGKPAWDAGSLWTIYSTNEDGSIIVSRMEDEEEETREALTAKLQVRSSVRGRKAAAMFYLTAGDSIEFIDAEGRFASGTVLEVDHHSRCYVVQSNRSFDKEYIPFNLTASDEAAFTSEEPSADDDFQFTPESHSEEAYTSDSANADDEYSQNMTDVSGFESMDEFDAPMPVGGEDKVEASNESDLETGYDDVQTLDFMGDSLYDDVEQQTQSVGEVVEAAFDFDFNGYDDGLDDIEQIPEDMQQSIDHYDFDEELYAQASVEDGLDDLEQPTMDLQSEDGVVDFGFDTADDWQDSVGESVEAPEVDLGDLHEVNRQQSAKSNRKDLWFI